MKTFTIFTGTYNSANIISRVFKSIERQSNKDFEWIIVDDCSTDNTLILLEEFLQKHPELDVTILRNNINKGVAVSRKEALENAKGKYFITWDHDDEQDPLQLDIYLELWKNHDSDDVANIFARMTDQHGKLLGKEFPCNGYVSDYISMHNSYLVGNKDKGNVVEHHVCVKVEKYLQIIHYYENNKGLLNVCYPNGAEIWGMMAYLGYKTIFSNIAVRTYYINEDGRQSMSSIKRKDQSDRIFRGKLLWVNYFDTKLSSKEYRWKLRNVFAVVMYGLLANKSLDEITSQITNKFKKIFGLFIFLPAKVIADRFSK